MSPWTQEELKRRLARSDDPEIEARRQGILRTLLADSPEVKEELIEEGQPCDAEPLREIFREGVHERRRSG
ncbi:hypothetical protein [Sorangium sp. So ce426]